MKFTRRQFLASSLAAGGLAVAGWQVWPKSNAISGKIVGASNQLGHLLRDGKLQPMQPTRTEQADIVIVGGGIAGLTAAYTLHQAGFKNFRLLELETHNGGNSSYGQNEVSAYPWGAHYVPLLSQEATVARKLFEDFGVITGYQQGVPVYNELYLCADHHERLYIRGHWQDELLPNTGINAQTEAEYQRFFAQIDQYKSLRGQDGKKVFAIPVDASSQDKQWLALDTLTMRDWMLQQPYHSEELLWYIDYCCRDDYGTSIEQTSAWAGLHYFAARNAQAANAQSGTVLTWPEGNGWLTQQLQAPVKQQCVQQALVYQVTPDAQVSYWDVAQQTAVRIQAQAVILAIPRFAAARLLPDLSATGFSYAPWAVANITLNALPANRHGSPLSWDNVAYRSKMLGYVTATHQITQMVPTRTVLTYYWPLTHTSPEQARQQALVRSYQDWQDEFVAELLRLHPELHGQIQNVDICLWGHAMVRPTPGFIWGEHRRQALQQHPPLFTAHSDMSGISIFEEACTHGERAAQQALAWLA